MQKYSDVVLDKNGKAVQGATVTVVTYPAGAPATIYAADGGPAVASVKTDQYGRFAFYAANGHYSFTVDGTGITPITYNDVTLFDPSDIAQTMRDIGGVMLGGGIPASTLGAVKNTTASQSVVLQAAWDKCAALGVPLIVDGVYWIALAPRTFPDGLVRNVGLQVPSNSRCVFLPGAALKIIPNGLDVGYGINTYLADNFELWNPVVYGERGQHTGSTGESVNCFNIVNCTNAYIHRPIAYDAWGDGIYVGTEFYAATNKQAQNVTLFEPRSYNARRNGYSVTSGVNIQVIRPHAEGVNGTFPQAGMDLELEGQGATLPVCDNWRIIAPTTRNCAGAGINVYTNGGAANTSVDIQIDKHKDYASVYGAICQHGGNASSGRVVFNEPVWADAKNNGVVIKTTTAGPNLVITNPIIENCGAAQASLNPLYDSAVSIYRGAGEPSTPTPGNFTVTGLRVRDTRATKKISTALYSNDQAGNNAGKFANAVIDLAEDSSAAPWQFTLQQLPDLSVKITTGDRLPITADITRGNNFFRSVVVPFSNAAYRNVYLDLTRQPLSLMSLCQGQALSIYPNAASRIYPIGSAVGKAIYSYDAGASINLYPVGTNDWVAEVVSGTWTSAA